MTIYESYNVDVKETLAQVQGRMNLFQGNMETILEILQTQTDPTFVNPAAANVTHAAEVTNATADVVATVKTPVETVAPTIVNHHLVSSATNRLAAAYPWGCP